MLKKPLQVVEKLALLTQVRELIAKELEAKLFPPEAPPPPQPPAS